MVNSNTNAIHVESNSSVELELIYQNYGIVTQKVNRLIVN
jgi:hypothetical protein